MRQLHTPFSLPPGAKTYHLLAVFQLLLKILFAAILLISLHVSVCGAEHSLSIDKSHSRIEVAVTGTMQEFSGKLTDFDADILADTVTGKLTKAVLRFKFSDLKTGDDERDEAMLAWEHYDQFPEAVFTLISFETSNPGKPTARGQLILHGVAQEITLALTVVTKDQLVYSIDGDTTLDTRDFGLPVLRRIGVLRIDPSVKVSFHLQGSASGK